MSGKATSWSPAEDEVIRQGIASGKGVTRIANMIDRPISSVHTRIIALSKPRTTKRNCMCCQRSFASEGPHNRLCTTCRQKSKHPFES